MAFSDHLKLCVLLNGQYQLKVSSISVSGQSGAIAVQTLEGLAGKTNGNRQCTVNITSAVATSGAEFPYWDVCKKGEYIDLQIPTGAKSIIGTFWIDNVDISQSTGASTELSFSCTGEFNEEQ